ncbi:MAG: hypothetical protein Q9166_005221 [cf. Caloplaca sp. 2 TL-2023]
MSINITPIMLRELNPAQIWEVIQKLREEAAEKQEATQNQLDQKETEIQSLNKQLQRAEEKTQRLKDEVKSATKHIWEGQFSGSDLKQNATADLDLAAKLEQAQSEIATLKADNDPDLVAKLEQAQSEIATLKANNDPGLVAKLQQADLEIATLKSDIHILQSRASAAEQKLVKATMDVSRFKHHSRHTLDKLCKMNSSISDQFRDVVEHAVSLHSPSSGDSSPGLASGAYFTHFQGIIKSELGEGKVDDKKSTRAQSPLRLIDLPKDMAKNPFGPKEQGPSLSSFPEMSLSGRPFQEHWFTAPGDTSNRSPLAAALGSSDIGTGRGSAAVARSELQADKNVGTGAPIQPGPPQAAIPQQNPALPAKELDASQEQPSAKTLGKPEQEAPLGTSSAPTNKAGRPRAAPADKALGNHNEEIVPEKPSASTNEPGRPRAPPCDNALGKQKEEFVPQSSAEAAKGTAQALVSPSPAVTEHSYAGVLDAPAPTMSRRERNKARRQHANTGLEALEALEAKKKATAGPKSVVFDEVVEAGSGLPSPSSDIPYIQRTVAVPAGSRIPPGAQSTTTIASNWADDQEDTADSIEWADEFIARNPCEPTPWPGNVVESPAEAPPEAPCGHVAEETTVNLTNIGRPVGTPVKICLLGNPR